jgi:thymidylate synthase
MSNYDIQYAELVRDIIDNGISDDDQKVRTVWADGTPAYTKSIISQKLVFDNTEVPILTTKRVAWKTSIHELLWFYVHRTSDVTYLRDNNVKIWDEWTREDNTIGKAYGYQLGKEIITNVRQVSGGIRYDIRNQVDILIDGLKNNPASRRHIISLWNIDDLHDMVLYPCVWNSQWLIKGGKLHLIVQVRSNDVALGQPFNVFQYYVLQRMVCQVTGYELGTLTFNINDCHIYSRHEEGLLEQISREPFKAPELWINPDVKNFDDFTIDDFKLIGYDHHPSIEFEVAI